ADDEAPGAVDREGGAPLVARGDVVDQELLSGRQRGRGLAFFQRLECRPVAPGRRPGCRAHLQRTAEEGQRHHHTPEGIGLWMAPRAAHGRGLIVDLMTGNSEHFPRTAKVAPPRRLTRAAHRATIPRWPVFSLTEPSRCTFSVQAATPPLNGGPFPRPTKGFVRRAGRVSGWRAGHPCRQPSRTAGAGWAVSKSCTRSAPARSARSTRPATRSSTAS